MSYHNQFSERQRPFNNAQASHFSSSDHFLSSNRSSYRKSQPSERNSVERHNSPPRFTSDPELLPQNSNYLLSISKTADKENIILNDPASYFTVGNPLNAVLHSNKKNNENRSCQDSMHAPSTLNSLNGNNLESARNSQIPQQKQPNFDRFRRSVSPIFEKYGLMERGTIQGKDIKNMGPQNESFGLPQFIAKDVKSGLGVAQNNNSLNDKPSNFRKENNSSGIELYSIQ